LQGYISPFVLRAQSLDMSLLSLCWHNKTLLPAKLPQSLGSQLANSCNISWGLVIQDCRDGELSPPLPLGCIPRNNGRRSHQPPTDSLIQRGDSSSLWVGVRASDTQQNPVRCRNQLGEGSTAHQTGKNPGSYSGLPQEAEGETDHLPESVSNCLFWGEAMSLRFGEQGGSTVLGESV
jgi:hypothetical protein